MARLQVGQNSWLASNSSKSFCCSRRTSLLSSYHHFAGVSWQQQRRKPPVLEAGARDGVRGDGIIGTYLHGALKDLTNPSNVWPDSGWFASQSSAPG